MAVESAIGGLLVVAAGSTIVGVYHEDHDPRPGAALLGRPVGGEEATRMRPIVAGARTPSDDGAPSADLLARACGQLLEYLGGHRQVFDVPFRAHGTPFQRDVWNAIGQVPFGQRCSYRDIATALGNPRMGRAVGAAVRANPLSILIPGHRVVSSSGAVTGYAAGTEVKAALLHLEQVQGQDDALAVGSAASDATERTVPPASPGIEEGRGLYGEDTRPPGKEVSEQIGAPSGPGASRGAEDGGEK